MDINLAGRTAVVTGGSKGIGLAVIRHLAASGARADGSDFADGAQFLAGACGPGGEREDVECGGGVLQRWPGFGDRAVRRS